MSMQLLGNLSRSYHDTAVFGPWPRRGEGVVGAEGRGLYCSLILQKGGTSHPECALGCLHPACALPTPTWETHPALTLSGRNLPYRPDRFSPPLHTQRGGWLGVR